MPRCSTGGGAWILSWLLAARLPRPTATGWITNAASSEAASILAAHSDETLACANNAWKAVDGDPGFGCPAATGCPATKCPVKGWNAQDGSEWLVLDFKRTLALSALRFSGAGDTLHDPKDMTISVGNTMSGPWRAVGDPFVGAAGTHAQNTFNEVWQEFGFPTTAGRYWKWEIASRHGGYQAWVGEVSSPLNGSLGHRSDLHWNSVLFCSLSRGAVARSRSSSMVALTGAGPSSRLCSDLLQST